MDLSSFSSEPKGAEQATRQGVGAWQKMQQYLRELAELKRNAICEAPARQIHGEAMAELVSGLLGSGVSAAEPGSASCRELRSAHPR